MSDDINPVPYHILSAGQFNRASLDTLCRLTDQIRRACKTKEGMLYLKGLLPHRRAMLYFVQPSTRTFLSFQSACQILGMDSSEIRDMNTSSERKGESVFDSIRTFSSYVDLIIMRTPIPGLCNQVADLLNQTPRPVPIINGGSGPDEHPTQALLDIYTLCRSFEGTSGITDKTILMVGDLRRGRTIRSLSLLLRHYENVKIIFCSPEAFSITQEFRSRLQEYKINFQETDQFLDALPKADAIYMTRVQDEYDVENESKGVDVSQFHLKYEHLNLVKSDAIIMHPLPRRQELDPRIDFDSRAKYWRQERNGMWTRVALLSQVMGVDTLIHQSLDY